MEKLNFSTCLPKATLAKIKSGHINKSYRSTLNTTSETMYDKITQLKEQTLNPQKDSQ